MTRLVHLSDLHFGRTDPAVVKALVADISRRPPDLTVISGDLTQGARTSEFRAARAFIDRLSGPVLAVPGNHDITPYRLDERFFDPYRRWRRFIGPEIEPEWQRDGVAVLGLNTARRMALHWNWSHGRVSRWQMRQIADRLRRLPAGTFRVVVAHHPFLPPEGADRTPLVRRAREAMTAFARAGVNLILSGHIHRGYIRAVSDTAVGLPERAGGDGLHVIHAATATSTRLRDAPNAYNTITVKDGRFRLQVREWDGRGWIERRPLDTTAIGA